MKGSGAGTDWGMQAGDLEAELRPQRGGAR